VLEPLRGVLDDLVDLGRLVRVEAAAVRARHLVELLPAVEGRTELAATRDHLLDEWPHGPEQCVRLLNREVGIGHETMIRAA
jgi:hypothetical protein